ncbi:universal stress protein [Aestuariibius sp. 2305UL40-4]|uniref:universal stress protein n=1 Tax=Aestuariibius violaceus TaxID=3234132 RepID=UPI00345E963A
MSLKTILVYLPRADDAPQTIAAAALLARRTGAHVIGLHVLEAIMVHMTTDIYLPGDVLTRFSTQQTEQAEKVESVFRETCRMEDFASEWRRVECQAAAASDVAVQHARSADLIILPQGPADDTRFNAALIRESGRPCLVIPRDGTVEALGRNVLVGWSATREAARAAHDALPLLEEEAEVRVVKVGDTPSGEQEFASNDMAVMFDRHGAKTTVVNRAPGSDAIGDVLMREAFESGADLIVTGAFGHSRAYDFVLGAVTSHLLEKAELPVLFSK